MLSVDAQPLADGGDLHGGAVAGGELVVPRRHRPMLLEAADPALDRMALLVVGGIESRWSPAESASPFASGNLVAPLRDGARYAARTQVETVGPGAVRLIGTHTIGPGARAPRPEPAHP